jgi:hypothetical protein
VWPDVRGRALDEDAVADVAHHDGRGRLVTTTAPVPEEAAQKAHARQSPPARRSRQQIHGIRASGMMTV